MRLDKKVSRPDCEVPFDWIAEKDRCLCAEAYRKEVDSCELIPAQRPSMFLRIFDASVNLNPFIGWISRADLQIESISIVDFSHFAIGEEEITRLHFQKGAKAVDWHTRDFRGLICKCKHATQ